MMSQPDPLLGVPASRCKLILQYLSSLRFSRGEFVMAEQMMQALESAEICVPVPPGSPENEVEE